jgi:hypothetical protein
MDFNHEYNGANDDSCKAAFWNEKEIRRQDGDSQQDEGSCSIEIILIFDYLKHLNRKIPV